MPSETVAAADLVAWALETFGDRFAVVTSFQAEGMALVDMAARLAKSPRVVTVDTGRLPPETYGMIEAVRDRYGIAVEVVSPDSGDLESMVGRHGPNLFHRDVSLRRLCCHFRKVRPLERKLAGFEAWASGLRREQGETRAGTPKVDDTVKPLKLNPLADWTREQLEDYLGMHKVPRHPLYERGYTSIGCASCTRAIEAGEDERAGRWWWEQDAAKECGIHFTPEGKAARTLDILIEEVVAGSGNR
ncbi:MAG: phosphoadenylyl-sulfate reductase [Bryobacteraceae bacterium]